MRYLISGAKLRCRNIRASFVVIFANMTRGFLQANITLSTFPQFLIDLPKLQQFHYDPPETRTCIVPNQTHKRDWQERYVLAHTSCNLSGPHNFQKLYLPSCFSYISDPS